MGRIVRQQHLLAPYLQTNTAQTLHGRIRIEIKNGNDLGDLDFDLVTLRSIGYVDLVHTYI